MAAESPVVLVKWYDVVKWILERVDSFPKNQRFVFGQRGQMKRLCPHCSKQIHTDWGKVTRWES
jgi:hypothetical protein